MNDTGILVDLSHSGYMTTLDAIAESRLPCIFSHANARALCGHIRNKSDEQIIAMAEKGGVMGIVNYAPFADIKKNRRPTLSEFIDIIEYVIDLVGVEHVGIGLDFTPTWTEVEYNKAQKMFPEIYLDYRMDEIPLKGLVDISSVNSITAGLLDRGYAQGDVAKIMGGNFMRVFRQVWK